MSTFLIIAIFCAGYTLITLEHTVKLNKTAVAILTAVALWTVLFMTSTDHGAHTKALTEHLASTAQVVFFLLGALVLVDIIQAHKGFRVIANWINLKSKRKMLWLIGFLAFFLSGVIDNLTTTVVMISLLSKILDKTEDRLLLGGAVVIAANAGGAWTPIGDVTTTMLWIGGQLSAGQIIKALFAPSVVCCVFAFSWISLFLKGNFKAEEMRPAETSSEPLAELVLALGVGALLFVPVFKYFTGLPPWVGIMLGLSVMWLITDLAHGRYDHRQHLRVPHILSKVDIPTTLFFLGILLAVNALEDAGILQVLAKTLEQTLGNVNAIAVAIGLISAVIDNVPLVAGAMGMYPMTQFATDSSFWSLLAFCAGTGGSVLIIGSAAGVAYMGIEGVGFFWYVRRVSLPALIGYFAGIAVFLIMPY